MNGDSILTARGILEAAKAAGWKPGKFKSLDGWGYPVYDFNEQPVLLESGQPMRRWKCFVSKGVKGQFHIKYTWIPDNRQDVYTKLDYYVLPGLRAAIADNDGTLYLTSGEPDTIVFRAAGASNSTNLFGESSFPVSFADDLVVLGVKRVVAFPDLDSAGAGWADRIVHYLASSAIEVFVYCLPPELGTGGDINKLWQKLNFDRDKFWDALTHLPEYEPKSIQTEVTGSAEREFTEADHRRFRPLREEVERLLQVDTSRQKPTGFYAKNVKCPFHDDETGSAGWNPNTGRLNCFSCHQHWGMVDVARRLGLSDSAIRALIIPEDKPVVNKPAPKPAKVDHQQAILATVDRPPAGMPKPIPNPFRSMWRYEGSCRSLTAGLMMAIIARSSGRKTGLLLCYLAACMQTGADVALYSPEWTEQEIWRWIIAQNGGPNFSDFMANDHWLIEQETGVAQADRAGRPFTAIQKTKLAEAKVRIAIWPGRLHYIQPSIYSGEVTAKGIRRLRPIDTELVLDEVETVRLALEAEKRVLRVSALDYLQLLVNDNSGTEADIAAKTLKAYGETHRLITIVPSQVPKELARSKDLIDMNAMAGARANAFQFILTINPTDRPTLNGFASADLYIAKNSRGKRNELVPVHIHEASGLFAEDPKQVNLNKLNDDLWAKEAQKVMKTEEVYED